MEEVDENNFPENIFQLENEVAKAVAKVKQSDKNVSYMQRGSMVDQRSLNKSGSRVTQEWFLRHWEWFQGHSRVVPASLGIPGLPRVVPVSGSLLSGSKITLKWFQGPSEVVPGSF